ncbi:MULTISPECIES: thioesterase family protein [Streptomyces]|uniref:Thioesterase family protein n=1 Tax=Streptomyces thermoviolaceus subsp. thermoviolaceus TaxID=66860 RepID=A0ABX0YSA3_STRTL|nr:MULTISPECIES: thioesterase family protein [Streptomyces]MCM3262551.1 thioesterase family protein [Streptomyces thermoviolaceus]NJP14029.1 thioesterase family protein [Streptomyces thermoviolaceus subsp. thermoviolaceus]RSS00621.1 thioesterase family protein [Streptomyces sp. WAC00469]WTD50382.1 thioesterase family protein [Streptomyces thermoviolaceus]GGV63438.1 thioesterase [Streptomyces thermoviolaceus subsp. apingens]
MTTGTPAPDSYYVRTDEHRFKPTAHAGGAWNTEEQHFSPLGGLVVHAVDQYLAGRGDRGLMLSRISYDILGRLALDECEIRVETVRPGRTIELLEAQVAIGGRPVVRARAWLLAAQDTRAVAGGADRRLPPPEQLEPWPMAELWPGGYIASLDVRPVAPPRPGRTTAWVATPLALVADEPSSPLASFLALVDTANGIAVRQSPEQWMFPNVDLTVHLHRSPEAGWTGLETTVAFGPTGVGLTSTVLHDVHGPVGQAQQILTVRPMPRS